MDPKEIKSLLKQAKTAYKDNDHPTCVKLCKNVIKVDPKNYTALVCMGAAYSASDKTQQSIEAYKQAITINPTQIPAWQGIVQHYEKIGQKSHPDLIEGYKKIATFYEAENDETKYIDNTMKFVGALIYQEEYHGALKVLRRLHKVVKTLPINVSMAVVQVVNNLKGVPLTDEEEAVHIQALEALIDNPGTVKDEYYKSYYTYLYKRNEKERIIQHCLRQEHVFNAVSYPTEYLCKLYVESLEPLSYSSQILAIAEQLFKLSPSNLYGYYARGKYYFHSGEIDKSLKWFKESLGYKFNEYAAIIYAQAKLAFGDFGGALETIEEFRKHENKIHSSTLIKLKEVEVEALMGNDVIKAEERLKEWVRTEEASEGNKDITAKLLIKIQVWKQDFNQVKELLPTLGACTVDLKEFLTILARQNENIAEEVEQRLSQDDAHVDTLILGGTLLWNLKHYTSAINVFSKLSKVNNYHPLPLMYLAKLYQMAGKIPDAAKQAELAYQVYPSKEAGILLSDLYFETGEIRKNTKLLEEATKRMKKVHSKWAWFRIGLLYLSQPEKINEATVALQSAVRTDYNDGHLWEALADAYLARGSLQSALKSYNKALELSVDPLYPKFKIGMLYQQLNDYHKAASAFLDLLSDGSAYVPAMVELSRTYYCIAKAYIQSKRDLAGANAVENSVLWAIRTIQADSSKALPWKIIGDCSLLMGDCASTLEISVPSVLIGLEADDKQDKIGLFDFLKIGTNCYHMALKACQNAHLKVAVSEMCHNIGQSYRLRAIRTQESNVRYQLLSKAVATVKMAVSKNRTNQTFWNTLGVIASHPDLKLGQLAQHAFIKSIQLDPSNAIAWCNLGMLHYHTEHYLHAHRCFSKAQTIDPSYSCCWVGQCLVAEAIKPEDAVDLFRHACLLENFPTIAVLGYTDQVCRLLASGDEHNEHYIYSIEKCEGVRTCFDLMSLYCVRRPSDPVGQLYKGLLAGRLSLLLTARESFEEALKLTPQSEQILLDAVRINLAATLMHSGDLKSAKNLLLQISNRDFTYHCVCARLHDKENNVQECEIAYNHAMEKASNPLDKSEVCIGLGIMHGKSSRIEEAKTCIFQGWQISREKINGLLAIVALCLQKEELSNSDTVIANAVYEQVRTVTSYSLMNDIAFIQAAWHLVRDDVQGGKNCILKIAHRYPWNAQLWNTLAHFLLETEGGMKEENFRNLVRKAVMRANVWERTSEVLIALSYLLEKNIEKGLHFAKKAVHSEPHRPSTWAVLLVALNGYAEKHSEPKYLKLAITIAGKALSLCTEQDEELSNWLQEYITAA